MENPFFFKTNCVYQYIRQMFFNYFSTSIWDVSKTYELRTTGEIITFELNVIMVMIDKEYQRLGNLYLLLPF